MRDHALHPRAGLHRLAAAFKLTCCAIGLTAAAGPFARGEIEFVGIVTMARKIHVALTDTTTARTDWVDVGQVFAGHTVTGYEPATETVTLSKNGTELRLRLKDDAKIKSARLELKGTVTFGTGEKIEISRATLLFDQENIFPLKDGLTYRITPQRHPNGNHVYRIAVERTLATNKTERVSAPTVMTLPGQSFAVQIGDIGFAFNPRAP